MSIHYVDASAWVKLIVEESESDALLDHISRWRQSGGRFEACRILVTELHRAGQRYDVPPAYVDDALSEVSLTSPDASTFRVAGLLAGKGLRSLDALHVAAAIEAGADAFITYDDRQADAARDAGFDVFAPRT